MSKDQVAKPSANSKNDPTFLKYSGAVSTACKADAFQRTLSEICHLIIYDSASSEKIKINDEKISNLAKELVIIIE